MLKHLEGCKGRVREARVSWLSWAALFSIITSVCLASCAGRIEVDRALRSGGAGGFAEPEDSAGAGMTAAPSPGGVGPYRPGPHGGVNQPCYPSATCDAGLHCTSTFSCAPDPNTGGASGSGDSAHGGAVSSTGGLASGGLGGDGPGAAGAPASIPFCAPEARPTQYREPLPFTATDAFIPSGWQGNPAAITIAECSARAPLAVGLCSRWAYVPPAMPDPWVGVAYLRMWDANYTHPSVCVADGVGFVDFYAKGALGGESVVFAAQGSSEVPFTLTNDWQLYRIPMSGASYNSGASGVELGFSWKLVAPVEGMPIPAAAFEVDSIQWVAAGGAGGTGGEAGASGELSAGLGGSAGDGS